MAGSPTTRMFNGSVLTVAGTAVANCVGLSYKVGGQWVDVSQPEDAYKIFEQGQPSLEIQVRYKGVCTLVQAQKGALAFTFSDGDTLTLGPTGTQWQCGNVSKDGSWDGPWTGSAEFRMTFPTTA